MKRDSFFRSGQDAFLSALLISLFLLSSTTLKSQAQGNFSGKWTFDKTKSTPGTNNADYPGTITREITLTGTTLAYRDIYAQPGTNGYTSTDIILNLDGKEEVDKSDPDVTLSKSLKWSEDKKSFTVTFKSTYNNEGKSMEILINETYRLTENGKTLNIDGFTKTELGEFKSINVYNKK